ncbi:MAG: adenylate/guanylate cyclase domain-containing protein, partial [Candidatus Dormibacteria bacterium]
MVRDGSLVFADISGFTALSERLAQRGKAGAEEVVQLVNHCFNQFINLAHDDGAGVLKFGGDALLFFIDGGGHEKRACRAAVRMQQALRELGALRTSVGEVELGMSIGIHSAPFHFFLLGESHRELIATGPEVSLAVELEHAASRGQVLVSEAIAAVIDEDAVGERIGPGYLLLHDPTEGQPSGPVPLPLPISVNPATFIPRVLRAYLADGHVEEEHRQATLGFVRFGGVDSLIRGAGPDAAAAQLRQLMADVQAAVDEEGVLLHHTDIDADGGKIYLIAGVPTASDRDEERMLRATRRILESSTELPLRIGVNRGRVFVGVIGTEFRRTFDVIGDAVNLAARLMSHAEPGQILASPQVVDRSHTEFESLAMVPFAVKGKAEPVQAFLVGQRVGARQTMPHRPLPLVGREREMRLIEASLISAVQGRGGVVELVGNAGIGKSRLLHEMSRACGAMGTWAAVCQPYESATPYFAFREMLRTLLDVAPGGDLDATTELLHHRVRALGDDLLPWTPLLAIPLDLVVRSTPEVEQLGSAFRRDRLNAVVHTILERALPNPTLFSIEDVHWMDEASADLLRHLARQLHNLPWLFCVTRRPEKGRLVLERAKTTVRIDLGALSAEASAELASAAATEWSLPPERAAVLGSRAGGNPLFLRELVRSAGEGGDAAEIPETVEAVITARIDRLDPRDRSILRCASVFGPSFSVDLISRCFDTISDSARESRTWARLSEFVEVDPAADFRFRHALFREVAYEGLGFRRRREMHHTVGNVIEADHGKGADAVAELLSLHFGRAEDHEKSWRYSLTAGDRASAKYANLEAAQFYAQALAAARASGAAPAGEVIATYEKLGDVSELAATYDQAADAYGRALDQVADGSTRARLTLKLGVVRERLGLYAEALT